MTKLEKAIRKIIHDCLQLKKDESLLVIVDEFNRELGYLLKKTALRVTPNTLLLEIENHGKNNYDLIEQAKLLMAHVDVTVFATQKLICDSKTVETACQQGSRIVCLSNLSLKIVERCINTDFEFIAEKSKRIADLFLIGSVVHIKSQSGTDITIPIIRSKGFANAGIANERGQFLKLPPGKASVSPTRNKAEGIIVVDKSMGDLGLLKTPVELRLKDGIVKKIHGNSDALLLRRAIKSFGEKARNFDEISVGTNPKAIVTGCTIEDEKVLGAVNISFGKQITTSKNSLKRCHFNAILLNATVSVDGHTIVSDGKLCI